MSSGQAVDVPEVRERLRKKKCLPKVYKDELSGAYVCETVVSNLWPLREQLMLQNAQYWWCGGQKKWRVAFSNRDVERKRFPFFRFVSIEAQVIASIVSYAQLKQLASMHTRMIIVQCAAIHAPWMDGSE